MRAAKVSVVFLCLAFASVGLLASGLFVSGCSSKTPAFEGIVNRGVTPISPQSPYMGSNIFLAQEMEQSLFLYNFIQSRGSPQAIQVQGSSQMGSELSMFYSREREYYSAIPRIDPSTKRREWIIRGPFPILREHYPHVVHLNSDQGGVFEVFGRQETFGGPGKALESREIYPAFVPTPQPTPRPTPRPTPKPGKRRAKSAHTSNPQQTAGPVIAAQGTPINLDQEALLEARRTPSTIVGTPAPLAAPSVVATPGRSAVGDALTSAGSVSSKPAAH
jgi:hypothetical protein